MAGIGLYVMGFILTMWYVNSFITDSEGNSLLSFILTMWYVNFLVYIPVRIYPCCFILTMWYVNLYPIWNCTCIPFLFYINYVVCKLFKLKILKDLN